MYFEHMLSYSITALLVGRVIHRSMCGVLGVSGLGYNLQTSQFLDGVQFVDAVLDIVRGGRGD